MKAASIVLVLLLGLGLPLAAQTDLEKATQLLKEKRLAEAQVVLEQAAQANPENIDVMELLGKVHLGLLDFSKAEAYASRALLLDPNRASAHCLMAMAASNQIQQANVFKKLSLSKTVLAEFSRALELDPRNREAQEGLFQVYCQAPAIAGGGLEKATALAESSLKTDPAMGHVMRARLFAAGKDLGNAQAEYLLAVAADPGFAILYNELGYLELEMGQVDLAVGHFRKQVALDSDNANAHDSLGDGLLAKGQIDEAIAAFRRCLVLAPDFAPAVYHLGLALERVGRMEEAMAEYQRAAAMPSSAGEVQLAKERLAALGRK
ncbi:MAG: tetratricopeptide repeat protein [Candidatus Aminicenantes bacterium]|nr:tetratricopeptide repeat protein [Candidatus Aminicenantes bacterium]